MDKLGCGGVEGKDRGDSKRQIAGDVACGMGVVLLDEMKRGNGTVNPIRDSQ